MRVSLLMAREPFGEILAATLAEYWTVRYGEKYRVDWVSHALEQPWWGNTYLNFFAASDTPEEAFSVLRREYSHSRVAWRRPLQKLYVRAATTFPMLRWLSNASFSVTPPVVDAGKILVLGGNHRLRLLEPQRGRSVVILKKGFNPKHIRDEIQLRTELRPACAPHLSAANAEEGWFEEAYVVGTPINRLSPDEEVKRKEDAVRSLWSQVVQPSLSWVSGDDWRVRIVGKFRELTERCDARGGAELLRLAEELADLVVEELRVGELPFSWTHGDFQEANIVASEPETWVIDWESADHRFAAYDFFQLATGGRWSDGGWPDRVAAAAAGASQTELLKWLQTMPDLKCRGEPPRAWTLAFLMEELWYRAADDADPMFYRPGSNWPAIRNEVAAAHAAVTALSGS